MLLAISLSDFHGTDVSLPPLWALLLAHAHIPGLGHDPVVVIMTPVP